VLALVKLEVGLFGLFVAVLGDHAVVLALMGLDIRLLDFVVLPLLLVHRRLLSKMA